MDSELGEIIEYNFAEDEGFDTFKMTSHYYFCNIKDGFTEQKFDDYEADLGFKPMWVDIDEAIRKNKLLLNTKEPPDWLRREIFALEYISGAIERVIAPEPQKFWQGHQFVDIGIGSRSQL